MPDLDDDERRRRLRLLMAWGGPDADYLELADWLGVSESTAKRRAIGPPGAAPSMDELRKVAGRVDAPEVLLRPWGAEPEPLDARLTELARQLAALRADVAVLRDQVGTVLDALGIPGEATEAFRRHVASVARGLAQDPSVRREGQGGTGSPGRDG